MTDKKINFLIDHIDPLGQGVYKTEDQIFFIPKTLPNESGTAKVHKTKKNINFANLIDIETKSEDRETSNCPHYDECNGCHFLHTSYKQEIVFKTETMKRMASYDFSNANINAHKAPRRFNYRNRIQLHYNKNLNQIGFINPKTKGIVEVSNCLMPNSTLSVALKEFLPNWFELAPKKPIGHVELYTKGSNVLTTWNKRYSESGFTQVYAEMNEILNNLVQSYTPKELTTLDLFGGAGNLSNHINDKFIIDYYEEIDQNNKFHFDLYNDEALSNFKEQIDTDIDCFIVDPPRKGFPLLSDWVYEFKPQLIVYVSCHSSTMFRDLSKIKKSYKVLDIHMLDLFPSTYHFEGLTVLERI